MINVKNKKFVIIIIIIIIIGDFDHDYHHRHINFGSFPSFSLQGIIKTLSKKKKDSHFTSPRKRMHAFVLFFKSITYLRGRLVVPTKGSCSWSGIHLFICCLNVRLLIIIFIIESLLTYSQVSVLLLSLKSYFGILDWSLREWYFLTGCHCFGKIRNLIERIDMISVRHRTRWWWRWRWWWWWCMAVLWWTAFTCNLCEGRVIHGAFVGHFFCAAEGTFFLSFWEMRAF